MWNSGFKYGVVWKFTLWFFHEWLVSFAILTKCLPTTIRGVTRKAQRRQNVGNEQPVLFFCRIIYNEMVPWLKLKRFGSILISNFENSYTISHFLAIHCSSVYHVPTYIVHPVFGKPYGKSNEDCSYGGGFVHVYILGGFINVHISVGKQCPERSVDLGMGTGSKSPTRYLDKHPLKR